MTNMTSDEQQTGLRDESYDLVSVLYHSLEGAATYAMYVQDAEEDGDSELSQFFQEIQEHSRAERAKRLLASRLSESNVQ
jgi:hypothetical protein